jgi:hypothetical protein
MESVMQQIRQDRETKKKTQADIFVYETVVEDCQVKMRFGNGNDSTIMETIRSMLLSAHLDNALAAPTGGWSDASRPARPCSLGASV